MMQYMSLNTYWIGVEYVFFGLFDSRRVDVDFCLDICTVHACVFVGNTLQERRH